MSSSFIYVTYAIVDGSSGFTKDSLNALRNKVSEMELKNKKLICGMMLDVMHIKTDRYSL